MVLSPVSDDFDTPPAYQLADPNGLANINTGTGDIKDDDGGNLQAPMEVRRAEGPKGRDPERGEPVGAEPTLGAPGGSGPDDLADGFSKRWKCSFMRHPVAAFGAGIAVAGGGVVALPIVAAAGWTRLGSLLQR